MYEKTVLDNGLRVLSSELPHTRSVSISLFVGAGSRYEPDPIAGDWALSHDPASRAPLGSTVHTQPGPVVTFADTTAPAPETWMSAGETE